MRQDDILDILREKGPMTAQQVGDALAPHLGPLSRRQNAYNQLHKLNKWDMVEKIARGNVNDGYLWRVRE